MLISVVGSFPFELKHPNNFKEKIFSAIGLYNPYKIAIKDIVLRQLSSGVDIVSDGQIRGDMINSITKYIPGMFSDGKNTTINSKILKPRQEITTNDLKYAINVLNEYLKNSNLSDEEKSKKGVKGILTGPSTLVHSSQIASFYKKNDDAILDLARSLRYEIDAISKTGVKYIQIDEPFLSTGMVNLKVAKKAINILTKDIDIPIAMHVCGNISNVFNDLCKFNIDILDLEFAGNNTNLDILRKNYKNLNGKKIGLGCIDTTLNKVDEYDKVKNIIDEGIDLLGPENIILDPDCGLRRIDDNIAYEKLSLIKSIEKEV